MSFKNHNARISRITNSTTISGWAVNTLCQMETWQISDNSGFFVANHTQIQIIFENIVNIVIKFIDIVRFQRCLCYSVQKYDLLQKLSSIVYAIVQQLSAFLDYFVILFGFNDIQFDERFAFACLLEPCILFLNLSVQNIKESKKVAVFWENSFEY